MSLPDLPEKGDLSDFIEKHGPEEAKALVLELASKTDDYRPNSEAQNKRETASEAKKPSRFKILIQLLDSIDVTFFKDQFSEAWACMRVDDHYENVRIRSGKFRHFLTRIFYEATEEGCGREILQQVQDLCAARAAFGGDSRELSNKFAWVDGHLLIDLSGPDWKCVKLSSAGWDIVTLPAPPFKRHSHMHQLPEPDPNGQITELLDFLPVKNENSRTLLLVWVVTLPLASVSRPIMVLHGLQGSGKSTISLMMRTILDPSAVPKLNLPTRQEELIQAIDHHALVNFDNIHELKQWQSDSICTAVTGGGSTKRTLFTDEDDTIFSYQRAFILNGINVPGTQPDLLDRALLVKTDRIEDNERLEEEEFLPRFDQAKPRIFGGLLNALSQAMAVKPTIRLVRKPRMADWTTWGCAVAEVLGIGSEKFLRAYHSAIQYQHSEIVEASPVCITLIEFMKEKPVWTGRSTDRYPELTKLAEDMGLTKDREWPGAPNALSRKLNELSHNLREVGIVIRNHPTARPRQITIQRMDPSDYAQTSSVCACRRNDNDSSNINSDDIPTISSQGKNTVGDTDADNQLKLLRPDGSDSSDDIYGTCVCVDDKDLETRLDAWGCPSCLGFRRTTVETLCKRNEPPINLTDPQATCPAPRAEYQNG